MNGSTIATVILALTTISIWSPSARPQERDAMPVSMGNPMDLARDLEAMSGSIGAILAKRPPPPGEFLELDKRSLWSLMGSIIDPAKNLPKVEQWLELDKSGADGDYRRKVFADLKTQVELTRKNPAAFTAVTMIAAGLDISANKSNEPAQTTETDKSFADLRASVSSWFDGSERGNKRVEMDLRLKSMGQLSLDEHGHWRRSGARSPEVFALRKALRTLQARGIDLHIPELHAVRGMPALATIGHADNGALYFNAESIAQLSREATLKRMDRLVHDLLADHLKYGLPRPMQLSHHEVAKGGLGAVSLTTEQAIAKFKSLRDTHIDVLLAWLFSARGIRLETFADSIKGLDRVPVKIFFDPVLDSLIAIYNDWQIMRSNKDGTEWALHSVPNIIGSGIEYPTRAIEFDPITRTLYVHNGLAIKALALSEDGKTLTQQKQWPGRLPFADALFLDSKSRRLWEFRNFSHHGEPQAVSWPLEGPHTSQSEESFANEPGYYLTAFNPESQTFYAVKRGETMLKAFDASNGHLGKLRQTMDLKHTVRRIGIEPASRTLAAWLENGESVMYHLKKSGQVEIGTPIRIYDSDKTYYSAYLTPLPGTGWLVDHTVLLSNSVVKAIFTMRAFGTSIQNWGSAADALARTLIQHPEKLQEVAAALRDYSSQEVNQKVWKRLTTELKTAEGKNLASLQKVPGSDMWYKDRESRLRERMPTVWKALANPEELGPLLYPESFLRAMHDFRTDAHPELAHIALAKRIGVEYRLNELHIVPISGTFRRLIIYSEKAGGMAITLKMPGDWEGRTLINDKHFIVAKEMWDRFPDPGVACPVYFGRFTGWLHLHGKPKPLEFKAGDHLGIMIFEYKDGRRWSDAQAMIQTYADAHGMTFEDVDDRILVNTAVASFRLHELGWEGSIWQDTENGRVKKHYDSHKENVSFLSTGESELAGDFGVYFRARNLPMADRSDETLSFLSHPGGSDPGEESGTRELKKLRSSGRLERLYPRIVARLANDGWGDRATLEKNIRQELGLDPPDPSSR